MSLFTNFTKLEFDYLIATCNFINEEFLVFGMKRTGAFNIPEIAVKRRIVRIKSKVARELADSHK